MTPISESGEGQQNSPSCFTKSRCAKESAMLSANVMFAARREPGAGSRAAPCWRVARRTGTSQGGNAFVSNQHNVRFDAARLFANETQPEYGRFSTAGTPILPPAPHQRVSVALAATPPKKTPRPVPLTTAASAHRVTPPQPTRARAPTTPMHPAAREPPLRCATTLPPQPAAPTLSATAATPHRIFGHHSATLLQPFASHPANLSPFLPPPPQCSTALSSLP